MVVFTKPALAAVTAAPAASAALRSFVGDGVSFFNSMRTPAALIAAAAVKDAFALSAVADDVKKSRSWTVLRTVYILLQLLAFSTEIGCVFVAVRRRPQPVLPLAPALALTRPCRAISSLADPRHRAAPDEHWGIGDWHVYVAHRTHALAKI